MENIIAMMYDSFRNNGWDVHPLEMMQSDFDYYNVELKENGLVTWYKTGIGKTCKLAKALKQFNKMSSRYGDPESYAKDDIQLLATAWGQAIEQELAPFTHRLVTGQELIDLYGCVRTCMAKGNWRASQLKLWANNPDVVQLLVVFKGSRPVARALVWANEYLDRVYTCTEAAKDYIYDNTDLKHAEGFPGAVLTNHNKKVPYLDNTYLYKQGAKWFIIGNGTEPKVSGIIPYHKPNTSGKASPCEWVCPKCKQAHYGVAMYEGMCTLCYLKTIAPVDSIMDQQGIYSPIEEGYVLFWTDTLPRPSFHKTFNRDSVEYRLGRNFHTTGSPALQRHSYPTWSSTTDWYEVFGWTRPLPGTRRERRRARLLAEQA